MGEGWRDQGGRGPEVVEGQRSCEGLEEEDHSGGDGRGPEVKGGLKQEDWLKEKKKRGSSQRKIPRIFFSLVGFSLPTDILLAID